MAIGKYQAQPRFAELAAVAIGRLRAHLPQPVRFLIVGMAGLLTDLAVFTLIAACGVHPLLARVGSIAVATAVTWRLNRAITFDETTRHQAEEAMRYGIVTLAAQATSYAVFSVLVLSIAARLPQAAVITGAVVGALVSYTGHRLFAFAPVAARSIASRRVRSRHAG
jgi:putative flippase GtrA